MNDLRLEVVGPETPDRVTLELLAQMLNHEFTLKAGVSFYFEVNPEQNGISIHFRRGEEYCVLNAVTTTVGTTIEMEMPSGTVAIFTRDHLDRTSPLWNN
jgi:hypothetical protein